MQASARREAQKWQHRNRPEGCQCRVESALVFGVRRPPSVSRGTTMKISRPMAFRSSQVASALAKMSTGGQSRGRRPADKCQRIVFCAPKYRSPARGGPAALIVCCFQLSEPKGWKSWENPRAVQSAPGWLLSVKRMNFKCKSRL